MLTQRHGQTVLDSSESLQADVMRFMAIIGFCLIAILALVRNVEPPPVETAVETPPVPAQIPAVAALQATPEPVRPPVREPRAPVPLPQPTVRKPVAEPEPEPEPVFEPVPETPVPAEPQLAATPEPAMSERPAPVPERPVEPEQPAEPEPVADPEPEARPEQPAEEPGLILRFASDGDFLRLIARGEITVYAFQDTDVLGLDESYRFLDTSSPGQVYELLNTSIPSLIVDALRRERADIQGFRWGIALPTRISKEIERHIATVTSGQLVIDRYGDVHHVAAS